MKRYLSLDILRGLTIFGMVFSAIIPYGVLPAWMYHIQTPPPNHAFDPTLSGVSWVDLVFPIFIFCMGMAIPFAGSARIEAAKGANVTKAYLGSTLVRFLMLWLFSYLYVLLNFSTAGGGIAQLATVAGFAALFLVYYVFPKNPQGRFQIWANTNRRIIRIAGVISVALLIAAGNLFLGEEVSIYRSGIIIFLLAFLYLFGSLIWYFTRDNLRARIVIFFLIVLFAAVTMSCVPSPKCGRC
jgi:multisubunit Na+/H+ antiporter MnhB subunit